MSKRRTELLSHRRVVQEPPCLLDNTFTVLTQKTKVVDQGSEWQYDVRVEAEPFQNLHLRNHHAVLQIVKCIPKVGHWLYLGFACSLLLLQKYMEDVDQVPDTHSAFLQLAREVESAKRDIADAEIQEGGHDPEALE